MSQETMRVCNKKLSSLSYQLQSELDKADFKSSATSIHAFDRQGAVYCAPCGNCKQKYSTLVKQKIRSTHTKRTHQLHKRF